MKDEDDSDALAAEYLQHVEMNETRDYVARGRSLAGLTDAEALELWIETFLRWIDQRDPTTVRNLDDAAAELRLRKLDLPEHRVRPQIEALQKEMQRLGPYIRSESLDDAIDDFLNEREKPKN